MTGVLPSVLCEHANENPNVCPCPPNCSCRTRMCEPSEDGLRILSGPVSDGVDAEARMLGEDCATVNLHYERNGAREGRTAGVLGADGSFVFGDGDAERIVRDCAGWEAFLDEVRSAMPAASVLLT